MESTEFIHKNSQPFSLDISHLISKHFGSLFTSDCIEPEIIENLKISQGSTDKGHVEYVTELIKITSEREQLYHETKQLRDHILWARDNAIKDDEIFKEENKEYTYLNLPPNESTFFKYIDNDLLQRNELLAPKDVLINLKEDTLEILSRKDSLKDIDSLVEIKSNRSEKVNSSKKKDFHLPPIESISQKSKPNTKTGKKPNLSDMILATEKDENRFMLDMIHAKNNYLKNPRHVAPDCSEESKDWLIQKSGNPDRQKIFLPVPEIVEFSEYDIGKVYQKLINFRNVTTVLRSIRVLPPKTRYFSLGLGQFPCENGLVAAGISCQYAVRFAPDSLGDYEDEIVVETQGELGFPVKLIAKRPRPILTGPTIWDMNFCLIYGLKVVHYKIKNIGGPGKFCIADSILPPVANSKAFINSLQIILEPFAIRPSHFELRSNESITLELIFCPNILGKIERDFIIICDNCHVETFKIIGFGEMASIKVESLEGGSSVPELDESTDISAQMLIKFNSLNPFTYSQKTLILKNESHTEIPFSWKIVKPNLKSPSLDIENLDMNLLKNRTLDFDSAFIIEPPFGVFPPNDSLPFTITFAPLEVKSHHCVFHLVLQGISDFKPEQENNNHGVNEGMVRQKSFTKSTEDSFPETSHNLSSPNTYKMGAISLNDVTSLEMEVKGISIPLKLRFNIPSLIIPGELLINTPVRKQLQIINESMCPVSLSWSKPTLEDFIFEVEPKLGLIDSNETGVVDVCVLASKPGFYRDILFCYVETVDNPLELMVEASFKGPDLEIDVDDLDFGLVRVNETVRRILKLFNKSSINCSWRAMIGDSQDTELFREMIVSPNHGVLGPLKTEKMMLTFTPKHQKIVNCGLEILLENSFSKFLNVLACVQCPRVVLSSSKLVVTEYLFVNTPSVFTITLCNQSHLTSNFQWKEAVGENTDSVYLFCEPSEGTIEPNGTFDIRLTITCKALMEINEILLPCIVENMEEPVLLSISGIVLGPSLSYSIFDSVESSDNGLGFGECLNFGNEVPLFKNVTKYLLIQNNTTIETDFELAIDYFKTPPGCSPEGGQTIKKRPNLADRQSKPENLANFDFCKSMLTLKNGLSVSFLPSTGRLQSFDKILVAVTAYNDMWGQYNDFVRIYGTAGDVSMNQISFPLTITVVGIPIEFTMTAGRKEQKPILRLGSRSFGEESFSRNIRLNNKSCCDLYINWEMYRKIDDSDDKIVDVIVNIDDAFPINCETKESYINIDSDRSIEYNCATESNVSNSTRIVTDRRLDQNSVLNQNEEKELISVIIRPHEGIPSIQPISFYPNQLKIPAESHSFVTITFNPQYFQNEEELLTDSNEGINFENFLLGFLSLDKSNLMIDNRISRYHQYDVEQIKLDITGRLLLPRLEVDYPETEEREEVFFSVPFSSLLIKDANQYLISKMKAYLSSVTLRNLKDCDIHFSLKTRSPFEIVRTKKEEEKEIKIGEVIKVNIKFNLDKDHLCLLKDENLYNHNDSHCLKLENQLLPNEIQKTAKMIQFRDFLTINYRNSKINQLIPIRAQIYFPEFIVSRSAIDFGTCFVTETSSEHIRVTNKSKSSSIVFFKLVNVSDLVFELSHSSGFIQSSSINSEESQVEILVKFTPKQAMDFSATLIISGIMGEEECAIPITAQSSYDNKYQKRF